MRLTIFTCLFLWCSLTLLAQAEDAAASLLNAADDLKNVKVESDGELPTDLENYSSIFIPNSLKAGLGYMSIDGQNHLAFRLNPELDLGKVGIGLDIPIWYNLENGKFRSEVFTEGIGFLRAVDYVRLGIKKRTNVYFKIGTLRGERLGYGLLLDNYLNSRSYERRRIGISTDILIKKVFGLEVIYGDINTESLNLLALRPYVRPLGRGNIPILKTLEVGFSFIRDNDATVEKVNNVNINPVYTQAGVTALGADLGVTFINTSQFRLVGYSQYGRLERIESDTLKRRFASTYADYKAGTGFAVGVKANISLILNLLNAHVRLERLFYSQNFIPQFFNATYTIDKDARIADLLTTPSKQGIYGSLYFNILKKITGGGSLLIPDQVSEENPAFLRITATVNDLEKINLNAIYTKGNIASLSDAVSLDENSLLRFRAAYQINDFLNAGVEFYWTFAETEKGFETTRFVYPYIGLNIPFNKKDKKGSE